MTIRNAGVMERYHVLLSQLGFDSCVVITGEYRSKDTVVLDRNTLYPALHCVILKHGALGVNIRTGKKSSDVPQFVRLPSINLDTVVEFRDEKVTDMDELLRSELERQFSFDTSTPLWHLTVLAGCTVVFSFHHVIGDGQSGPAFLHALLSALNASNEASSGGCDSEVLIPADISLVEPTEAYTSIFPSMSEIFHTISKMAIPSSWTHGPYAWTGNPVPRAPCLDMTVRCWKISAAHTHELLRLCREHRTTVTTFLYTLVIGVLSRMVTTRRDMELEPYRTISSVVAVSLRRFTGVSPLELCDHVCSTQSYVPLHTVERDEHGRVYFPWALTAQYGEIIRKAVERSRDVLGMLQCLLWLGMGESYFLGMLGKKRETGLTLSNLGKFPAPLDTQNLAGNLWMLKNVYIGQCDVVRGAAIKVNVVGSPEGTTNVTFTWGRDSIDAELAEDFVREVKNILEAMMP